MSSIPWSGHGVWTRIEHSRRRATLQDAERFKHQHGYVGMLSNDQDEEVEIESVQGSAAHKVSKKYAGYILQARAIEIFSLLQEEIKRSSYTMMTAGLVLTGGGIIAAGY